MSKQAVKQVAKVKPKSIVAVNLGTKKTGIRKKVDRHEMIALEAYFLAAKRNFQGGDPVGDWLEAELKIDSMLNKSKSH